MKLTTFIFAATLAASAAAADTNASQAFSECGAHQLAASRGLTVAQVRAEYPKVVKDAEDQLFKVAEIYFSLPVRSRVIAQLMLVSEVPDIASCVHILNQ